MGNEESTVVDESTRPSVLEARSMEAVAKYIKQNDVKRIVLMVGAGISTSAGIPDFRSPDTGLYANLAFLDLEEPEDVFDITFFRENPKPFYALGMLLKHFTQNIDCLERQAGVPGEMIVEAHGSFASQRCIECKTPYPDEEMHKMVDQGKVPRCGCGGYVKPDIVFFGEALPSSFFENRSLPAAADLCIVMGTSLSVQPFASLPSLVSDGVPRVLINMQKVGGMGSRPDDVLLLGDCDAGVRKFAKAMGWEEELEALWGGNRARAQDPVADPEPDPDGGENAPQDRDERLREEVDRLTQEVDRSLHLTDAYQQRVREKLDGGSNGSSRSSHQSNEHGGEQESETVSGLSHVFPHLAHQAH
ncbi:NAD-dependent protein deacetylase hst2-1 [Penicillium cosmopolitanum]|uniref:NAD-dependent protein deacetylase n=1 Tax=Penicillium cosmopolitanum TaxID=1131564 RepID=A0A9X0BEG1_9EURO|nr:NAD-dependent protein deacetylase hst2-1 [Penicillium cosmopolitanum]KAJ5414064.1 NAD-dependent protein deacetylase hst2-1 [Penicillium cosmopolitanum]